ncbi:MAG: glycosyltransferase family 2 protein [Bacteroidota bacterium]
MKISIITPSFNQAQFIERTIQSVMRQDHSDVEHIVIDGGSHDGTVEILRKYQHLQWVSERDTGQSNAINKGFARATGNIVAWLNSDDFYEENVFGSVERYFLAHPECMVLYGDITFVDRAGSPLYTIEGNTISFDALISCPDIVRQPSFFWRRELLSELGGVDESLRLVMDFDFLLRAGRRHRFHYLKGNLSYYRLYVENKSLSLARQQVAEMYRVYRKNSVPMRPSILKFLLGKYARTYNAVARMERIVRPSLRPQR